MPITHMAMETAVPTQILIIVTDSRNRLTLYSTSRKTWAVRQRIRRVTHMESTETRI